MKRKAFLICIFALLLLLIGCTAKELSFDAAKIRIAVGDTIEYLPVAQPKNARFELTSENESIAEITEDNRIKGVKAGTTVVYAKSSKAEAFVNVEVINAEVGVNLKDLTVHLSIAGAEGYATDLFYYENESISRPDIEVANHPRGYSFDDKWYTDAALKNEITFPYNLGTQNITLYAAFKQRNGVDASFVSGDLSVTLVDGATDALDTLTLNGVADKTVDYTQIAIPKLYTYWQKVTSIDASGKETVGYTPRELPITTIANNAFEGATSLRQVDISYITNIGDNAFKGCTSLAKVTLSPDVKQMGDRAFFGCTMLSTVAVGTLEWDYELEFSLYGTEVFHNTQIYSDKTTQRAGNVYSVFVLGNVFVGFSAEKAAIQGDKIFIPNRALPFTMVAADADFSGITVDLTAVSGETAAATSQLKSDYKSLLDGLGARKPLGYIE